MKSLKGQLLISNPAMMDPNFRHTVVLVAEHNEDGAVGVILNRPTPQPVHAAVPPLAELTGEDATLFEGGPVQSDQPVLLVQLKPGMTPDLPILGPIGFMTGEIDDTLRPSVLRARVFAGYAGWGEGQLDDEMDDESWIVEPATSDDIFSRDPEGLWRRVLQRKGGEYRLLAMIPKDPRVN